MNLQDLLMGSLNDRVRTRTRTRQGATTTTSRNISARPGTSVSRPGSSSPSPNRGQDAINFGRSFTGGGGPGADAVDRLSRDIFSQLSQKGLYKDPNGTWQIRGQERPDVTRQIRDAAVAGMGGPGWTDLVKQSDRAAAGPGAGMSTGGGTPGVNGGVPSPGLGGVPAFSGQQSIPESRTQSDIGSSIANQVKQSVGQMPSGTEMAAGIQAKMPTPQSIQSVVEASLRSRGATTPTSGPLAPPSTSGPQVGGMPGNAPGGTMAHPGQQPATPPGGSVPWPSSTGQGSSLPTQGQGQGQDLLTPKPTVTMYPNPATREGTASTTAPVTQTPIQTPVTQATGQRMGIAAPAPSGGSPMDATLGAAANNIILQESGGAGWTPNNTNCAIRAPDCLDLNTGIFKSTADSWGLDWNRLMTDSSYAPQAVGQLLTNYANQPAGNGQTVWEYGEANLPGGGLEAVGRYYFGGCVTNGCFVDEQGRSVDTYGQQFVAKMGSAAQPGMEPPSATGSATPGLTGAVGYSSTPMDIAAPGAGTSGGVGAPQGTIPTDLNLAYGRGDDWNQVNQYDALFTQYGNQYGVDPAMLKSIAVVETGGRMIPNGNGNAWSGMMQIDGSVWGNQAAQMGFDLNTPEGQVGFAAAMLGGAVPGVTGSTPEERFVNNYYPTGCMDCVGADGGTPRQYLEDIATLTGIINAAGGGMQAAPQAAPGQTLGGMGVTTPQGNLTPGALSSLGVTSPPPTNAGGSYPDVYSSGSATQISYNPGGGPAGHIDPNTGQFVVDQPGVTPPSQGIAAPAPSGGAPISSTPPQFVDMVNASATKYGVPPNILSALIQTESGWDPNATNAASGAQGMGQCMPDTCASLGVTNPYDPAQAIDGAANYLKQNYDMFGSWELALAAYQAGPGNVQAAGNQIPDLTDGITRTPDYVSNIMGLAGPVTSGDPMQQKSTSQATPAEVTQPPPVGPQTGNRGVIVTGVVDAQPSGDGMGMVASPDSDEGWRDNMAPGSEVGTEYKQPVTWSVDGMGECPYCYQDGHGADGSTHAGMDITVPGGYGAQVGAPVSGRVVCSGYGNGSSVPGWNCGYAIATQENGCKFEDNCGPSQVTLDVGTDVNGNQLLVNMIHLGGSYVTDGQIIQAGEPLGTQGSMNGSVHTHTEGLAICHGNYIYLDPTLVIDGYYDTNDACQGY